MTSENIILKPIALRSPTANGVLKVPSGEEEVGVNPTFDWRPTMEIAAFMNAQSARNERDVIVLGSSGRDQLTLTDLRKSPQKGIKQASVRLTGNRMWLNVSAQATDVDALGGRRSEVLSLWLAAAVATREHAMESGETKHLWLVGLDDTQLLEARPDGFLILQEVATGLNRLVDLVQKEMSLHFRSSAFDLLFNEDFEWDQAPEEIIANFVSQLNTALGERSRGEELAVVGLGPRLGPLTQTIARAAGMAPWRSLAGWDPSNPQFASLESWLMQRIAPSDDQTVPITAAFGGAPLLLPRPGSEAESETTSQPQTTPQPEAGADAAAEPAGEGPSPRKRRRRFGRGWLRHHSRPSRSEAGTESNLRKILFVVVWVVAVALAGHLFVEQSTERARMQQ